jgi:mannose-6-phosphate isomerase-like protein (cupin superfamily)
MHVIHHAMLARHAEAGCCRQTVAGGDVCAAPFEVQLLVLEPGACTPQATHRAACVVVALEGSGKLMLECGPERFQAPCTLAVAAGAPHRIVNNAAAPLQLVCVHGAALDREDA